MPFNIIRNDITRVETDAVVNAANSMLKAGGGACGAIFAAAGAEKLQKECDKIGFCPVGDAVITKGYNLKAKYIIHTVGPVYGRDPALEKEQLRSCYINSLKLAKEKKLASIAFPLISSGIFGYPKEEAINVATSAVKEFLNENEMDIYLVIYDNEAFHISEKLFEDVRSYIDERSIVKERRRIESSQGFFADYYRESDVCIDEEKSPYMPRSTQPKITSGLKSKKSLEDLLNKKAETFSEMLLRLIDEKEMSDVEVYKRANIDRKLFSKMRKRDYTPKKTTVLALVIALRLDMGEARELLSRAGFAFSECNKGDIIIEYFIENKNYDIFEINETLFAFDQKLLGG